MNIIAEYNKHRQQYNTSVTDEYKQWHQLQAPLKYKKIQ